MESWLSDVSRRLSVAEIRPEEVERLLELARAVAHGVERKAAPLVTFILGMAAERAVASGTDRPSAFAASVAAVMEMTPDPG